MRALLAATALMMGLSVAGHAQSDTTRPLRIRGTGAGGKTLTSDSIRAEDLETVEVLKGAGARAIYPNWMDPAERRAKLEELEGQLKLWRAYRPRTYVIRLVVDNHCIFVRRLPRVDNGVLRDQLVVRDTTVVRRQSAPMLARYAQSCPREWRIDDLFADIASALADTNASVRKIRYDELYGVPRDYFVVRGASRGDRVMVESFAPVR